MTVIFDGSAHAEPILENLTNRVRDLKDSYSITPHLAVFMIGDPPGGKVYTQRKKQTAERVGAKLTLHYFDDISDKSLITKIETENEEPNVHGIMIQLPLPDSLFDAKDNILNAITPKKDIDGLGKNAEFTHPTSLAILDILENSLITDQNTKILLIGSQGFVGAKTFQLLKTHGMNIKGIDVETKNLKAQATKADVIILATSTPNLIDKSMVRNGVNIIDIGYPAGNADKSVLSKTKFITPIVNGVGPLTIAYLLENLIFSAEQNLPALE